MKRKLLVIYIMILSFMFSVNIYAESTSIVDDANLLTEEQRQTIADKVDEIRKTYDFDVTILTVENSGHLESYAETHPARDMQRDGIVFAHDTFLREYFTIGRGYGITVISDTALTRIDEVIVPYLQSDDFFGAYMEYLNLTTTFLESAATGVPYEGEPLGMTDFAIAGGVGLASGVLISFIITKNMQAKMNTARKKREATNYVKQGSFMLGQNYERFLYENTTRKKIEKNDKSKSNSDSGGRGGGSY